MKKSIITFALLCALGITGPAFAQAPGKSGDKKAPAPKSAADTALDAFNKAIKDPGAKDQARFQKVIGTGLAYVIENPTHGGVTGAVNNLGFYAASLDKKQPTQRIAYLSLLKLEVTNAKYKDGVTDNAKAALAAIDAAIADYEIREAFNRDNLTNFREKIDALAEVPGSGRFLTDRERSYVHVLALGAGPGKGEDHLKKLLNHKEKGVKDMARSELNVFEAKKEPLAAKFTTLDGKEVDFAQLRGKVVALYFWSSASKSSTDRFEQLKQIQSNYKKKGLEIVTVSYDKEEDREKLLKYIKDTKLQFPVAFDGTGTKNEVGSKLSIDGVPRILVFDQKGMLQTTLQGSPVARLTPDLPLNQLEGMTKKLLGIK